MSISPIGVYSSSSATASLPFKVGMPGAAMPSHIPSALAARRRIMYNYGIQVLDSDVKFSGAEVLVIEKVLKDVKKKKREHLIGVKEIVKNKEIMISLLKGALVHAGGAYVAEQKRVYIFDELPVSGIPEVLIHEIGHAVNHFNLSFGRFMDFVSKSGWNMTEVRRIFLKGNIYYQFGVNPIEVPADKWGSVWDRFSMNSLMKEQDVFGEFILQLPRKKDAPWDENPLESFAWTYEWFYDKPDVFKKIAYDAEQKGDPTLRMAYEFMEKEVFGERDVPEGPALSESAEGEIKT